MDQKILEKLFLRQLRETSNGEKQLLELLPQLLKACANPELKSVIHDNIAITKEQIRRNDSILKEMEQGRRDEICHNIEELVDQAEDIIEDGGAEEEVDACIINIYQKIQHYQIACYSTLVNYSKMLGNDNAHDMLQRSLDEEYEQDNKLDKILEQVIQVLQNS